MVYKKRSAVYEKLHEAISSVLPIVIIVLLLSFTVVPVEPDLMLSFLTGALLLVIGSGLFNFGCDTALSKIGSMIGAKITQSRNLGKILGCSFLLGCAVTIAEPDLSVLAANVPHIQTVPLMITVSVGVGIFLPMAMLRILLGVKIRYLLIGSYLLVFVLAFFSDPKYLSVAFDAGGVTTGPMTAPFIISLGVGVSSIRSDKNAEADSFGLVGLCSIGPILAVLLLGFIYPGKEGKIAASTVASYANTVEMSKSYLRSLPSQMEEVALALLPVMLIFLVFQFFSLKIRFLRFIRILVGMCFTYVGLVVFLVGVNVGFSPIGMMLGRKIAEGEVSFWLIPIVALMGWFLVAAEPAVHTLTEQVEEISAGAVSTKTMKLALSVAVSLSMVLSMVRIQTGIPILYFVFPGYLLALVLTFFVPPVFTAIAFDAGGVASGPMAATFMLPFAMGVCMAKETNLLTEAFGLVSLVAMLPLITVQLVGLFSQIKKKRGQAAPEKVYKDTDIIELF